MLQRERAALVASTLHWCGSCIGSREVEDNATSQTDHDAPVTAHAQRIDALTVAARSPQDLQHVRAREQKCSFLLGISSPPGVPFRDAATTSPRQERLFFSHLFFNINKRLLRQKTGGACLYMPQDGH